MGLVPGAVIIGRSCVHCGTEAAHCPVESSRLLPLSRREKHYFQGGVHCCLLDFLIYK